MNTYEIEEWGKKNGFDSAEFTIVNKFGETFDASFLDAYYGHILIPSVSDGFFRLDNLKDQGLTFIPKVK